MTHECIYLKMVFCFMNHKGMNSYLKNENGKRWHKCIWQTCIPSAYNAWWVFLQRSLVLTLGILRLKGFFLFSQKSMEALISFHFLECYSLLVVQLPHTPPATYRTNYISGHSESPRLQIWLDGYIGDPLLCDIRAQLAVTRLKKKKSQDLDFQFLFSSANNREKARS